MQQIVSGRYLLRLSNFIYLNGKEKKESCEEDHEENRKKKKESSSKEKSEAPKAPLTVFGRFGRRQVSKINISAHARRC